MSKCFETQPHSTTVVDVSLIIVRSLFLGRNGYEIAILFGVTLILLFLNFFGDLCHQLQVGMRTSMILAPMINLDSTAANRELR